MAKSPRLGRTGLALALASTSFLSAPALARSSAHGPSVISGDVTFARSGHNLTIDVLSQNATIALRRLRIAPGATVTIDELDASSVLVAEVRHGPALVLGTIDANGQLVVVDPAGITIGRSGTIVASGLVLSTATPSAAASAGVPLDYDIPGADGAAIVNRGKIEVSGGAAILAGATVANDGLITAELSTVVLAGTETFTLDFAGDGLLRFAASTAPVASVPAGTTALVQNGGTIDAAGGTVLLTAAAAKDVLDNVINTSGIIEATSVATVDGKIVLSASGGGTTVSGTLDASGKGAGESGGTVEVLGDHVALTGTARIDVSGAEGGGTALVGGNFHGTGPEPNAATTTIATGAVIDADALSSGSGGTVAVWSNDATVFNGTITARGGIAGGSGGFVETSGGTLAVASGTVDTLAPAGATGTWLLDPTNITVATSGSGVILPGAIDGASSNVVLQAANDIVFASPVSITTAGVGLTAEAGDSITVQAGAPITTNGGSITLSANDLSGPPSGHGSIVIDAPLSTLGADPLHPNLLPGGIILSLDGSSGSITLDATVITTGGIVFTDGVVDVAAGTTRISGGDIALCCIINGPGALVLNAGPATSGFDELVGYGFPTTGNIVLNDAGSTTPLASLTATAAGAIAVGNVITNGPQTYRNQTLYLMGTRYQTSGAPFAENGATILGGPPFDDGGAGTTVGEPVDAFTIVADPTIDTTGSGSVSSGAAVTFAGPGSIDGDEALDIAAGSGAISVGRLGATTPLGPITMSGGSIALSSVSAASVILIARPDAPGLTFEFPVGPAVAILADTTAASMVPPDPASQQVSGRIYATSALDDAAYHPPLLTIVPLPLPPDTYGPADAPIESTR